MKTTGLFYRPRPHHNMAPRLVFRDCSGVRFYNTVKSKLITGQQVVGGTVDTADPEIYCAMANAGFDFIWIEMQHSPLSFSEAARMIWACRDTCHTVCQSPRCQRRNDPEGHRYRRVRHYCADGRQCGENG